jgi:hypothetical protein
MNAKWKIALLAMLGLSTAACCSTKKSKKSEDPQPAGVEDQMDDPRVMLMYGVPFPDGQVARPVEDVKEADEQADEQAARLPDGAIAHPISEEEAVKLIEQLKAEEAARAAQQAE